LNRSRGWARRSFLPSPPPTLAPMLPHPSISFGYKGLPGFLGFAV
jgi:hypothetical protein